MRLETARPLLILGRDFLLYCTAVTLAVIPLPLFLPLLGSIVAGIMIGAIFVSGHDACHQALTPHRGLNDWIGRLAMAPAWTTQSLWKHFHNRVHHCYTNVIGVDYAWSPMSLAAWRRSGMLRKTIYRLYRSPFGFLPYYLFEMWWKCHFLPFAPALRARWREHLPNAAFATLWQAGLIAVVLGVGGVINPQASTFYLLAIGWLVPYLVWNGLMGWVIYAHHTHPRVAWYSEPNDAGFAEVHVMGVVHAVLPQPLKLLSSNIMEHNAHHAAPTLPHYHLAEAQRQLEASFPSIPRLLMYTREMLAVIGACKLYDTERHCWSDYTGRPSGPLHLPPA